MSRPGRPPHRARPLSIRFWLALVAVAAVMFVPLRVARPEALAVLAWLFSPIAVAFWAKCRGRTGVEGGAIGAPVILVLLPLTILCLSSPVPFDFPGLALVAAVPAVAWGAILGAIVDVGWRVYATRKRRDEVRFLEDVRVRTLVAPGAGDTGIRFVED
jgi:hypothetical protein